MRWRFGNVYIRALILSTSLPGRSISYHPPTTKSYQLLPLRSDRCGKKGMTDDLASSQWQVSTQACERSKLNFVLRRMTPPSVQEVGATLKLLETRPRNATTPGHEIKSDGGMPTGPTHLSLYSNESGPCDGGMASAVTEFDETSINTSQRIL